MHLYFSTFFNVGRFKLTKEVEEPDLNTAFRISLPSWSVCKVFLSFRLAEGNVIVTRGKTPANHCCL